MERSGVKFLRWSGVLALIGAAMWSYKSIVILITGDQPDYWFELAFFFFGVSIVLLLYGIRNRIERFSRLVTILGWLAAAGGASAGVAYAIEGDGGVFGLAALLTMLSTIVTLFLIGGQVRRSQLLPKYSFAPRLLAWLYVGSIPVGAVLAGIDERLLEVGLMGTVAGWVVLALGSLGLTTT